MLVIGCQADFEARLLVVTLLTQQDARGEAAVVELAVTIGRNDGERSNRRRPVDGRCDSPEPVVLVIDVLERRERAAVEKIRLARDERLHRGREETEPVAGTEIRPRQE